MFPIGWHGSSKKPGRADSKRIARPCAPAARALLFDIAAEIEMVVEVAGV